MLVLGGREVEGGTLSVRERSGGDIGAMSFDEFAQVLAGQPDPATCAR